MPHVNREFTDMPGEYTLVWRQGPPDARKQVRGTVSPLLSPQR